MRKPWTDGDVLYLHTWYADTLTAELATKLHRPTRSVYAKANGLGLKKSAAFLNSPLSHRLTRSNNIAGIDCRFEAGHIPYNKGKKWDDFFDKEAQEKSLATAFKKGHIPHNTKADGEISIRKDDDYEYQWIRVALGKWVMLHVYNWEKEYGPVPQGCIVVFKTPDRLNCDISNLELIKREEHMLCNSIQRYPPELKSTIRTYHKLIHEINGKE